jgi:ABC-type multidrug transport system ATPase subunit
MAGLKGLNESVAKQRIEELLNTLNLTHAANDYSRKKHALTYENNLSE